MHDGPDVSRIAALIGDPARSRMLEALLAGRALTATELALEGDVAPSTASSHLEKMAGAGLLKVARQGRHRYFQLASAEVATAIEALMAIAPRSGHDAATSGSTPAGLRWARVCYDHLAGESAVQLLDRLGAKGWVQPVGDALRITGAGEDWLQRMGVDVASLRKARRPLCRPCLDWSERRSHLAGAVGAALLTRLLALRLARRATATRAVTFSPRGLQFLEDLQPLC